MPITFADVVADLSPALSLAQSVEAAVKALPASAKPSDYCALGAAILTAAGPLADKIAEQAKGAPVAPAA